MMCPILDTEAADSLTDCSSLASSELINQSSKPIQSVWKVRIVGSRELHLVAASRAILVALWYVDLIQHTDVAN